MGITLTEQEQLARNRVCLPLDGLASLDDFRHRVEELAPVVGLYKIGMESYTRFGPEAVHLVQRYGSDVFLDLKYKDIPNTVRGAAMAATELGVSMFTIHIDGGEDMIRAAIEGAHEGAERYGVSKPQILGVTVLTSLKEKDLRRIGISSTVEEQVKLLGRVALDCGLDSLVCSAQDLSGMKEDDALMNLLYVTPGIKGPNTSAGSDQKRVMTPGYAIQSGSHTLVIGRAITAHPTPEARLQAGYEILKDMAPHM